MSTTTPTKTKRTALFPWADVATGNVSIGTPLDVSGYFAGNVYVNIARKTGSAFTAGWPNILIQGCSDTAAADGWITLVPFQPAVGASIASTTISVGINAGSTTVQVGAATNIAAGDMLFLGDASTGNYEVVRVKSVSSTTITFWEGTQHGHTSTSTVTDQPEQYPAALDLTGVLRLRVVTDNAGSGQTMAADVQLVTLDSLGTA